MPRELNEFFFPPALELNLSSFHFILSVFFVCFEFFFHAT